MKNISTASCVALIAATSMGVCAVTAPAAEPPRLGLQVTVDALRGDMSGSHSGLYGEGGFRYLLEEGVHNTNAHDEHASTETIVGHVSLATGTVPAAHGMVGKVWFDRETGRLTYNIEEADHRLLSAGADVDNAGLEPRKVCRPVTPSDIAATLANHLGVKPPSGSIGNLLPEVVGD